MDFNAGALASTLLKYTDEYRDNVLPASSLQIRSPALVSVIDLISCNVSSDSKFYFRIESTSTRDRQYSMKLLTFKFLDVISIPVCSKKDFAHIS